MTSTAIINLAAGASTRLGRPKQLIAVKDKSVIEILTEEAVKAGLSPVIVVTGALHDAVKQALASTPAHIIYNKRWQQGIGTHPSLPASAYCNHLILMCIR